jgi:hypothetical protein
MAIAKAKAATLAAAIAIFVGGTATLLVTQVIEHWPRAEAAATPAAAVTFDISAPASGPTILTFPGSITSTPSLGDLDGDGRMEIIVTCMARQGDPAYAHASPTFAAQVIAYNTRGITWPLVLMDAAARQAREQKGLYEDAWFSSPSLITNADGTARFAVAAPHGLGLRVITASANDVTIRPYRTGNQWNPPPIVDIDGDGTLDVIMGNLLMTVEGTPVSSWPSERWLTSDRDGFAPAVGDANGDGSVEVYLPMYRNRGIAGYDHQGQPLPHFPRDGISHFAPAMGDVRGGTEKEIVYWCIRGEIHVCDWDGGNGGIFKRGLTTYATPTLADLDGDGKAEIIIYDHDRRAVRAWHGDGRPVAGANADGDLVVLATPNIAQTQPLFGMPWAGVSVADLGGDGILDLFCGTYWIRYNPGDGSVQIQAIIPPAEMNLNQPSIGDVDGDGNAEVVLGLRDGRLIIHHTGLAYIPELVQWATVNGNYQHTSDWSPPATAYRTSSPAQDS